jgi:hypothetical protein
VTVSMTDVHDVLIIATGVLLAISVHMIAGVVIRWMKR